MILHNKVILVDTNNTPVGMTGKMEAHLQGMLHRAVSVFSFNKKGEWLLQQPCPGKYHSKGLWTKTCFTHPYSGEEQADAANRLVTEEMGLAPKLAN